MSELISVSRHDLPDCIGDVIFVHGLDGDATTTWQHDNDSFWPRWLAQDLLRTAFWSLDYDVSSLRWRGNAMPLADRATNILHLLEVQDIGKRPLVFVTHSLGGLLVKQMLRHALDFGQPAWKAIAGQTKGIVFISTPHSGSGLANWLRYLSLIMRPTEIIPELTADNPYLRNLNLWYTNQVGDLGVRTRVYCEKIPLRGFIVVDETSANPGIPGVIPVPMDDDHHTISKPKSKTGLLYLGVKRFIEDCFTQAPVRINQRDEQKRHDDKILKAATDLVDSLRALDNAAHDYLKDLVMFKPTWSQEQRKKVIDDINAFAHREEIITRARRSLGELEYSKARADDQDKDLIQTIFSSGEELLAALSGTDATFFPNMDELEVYLHNIDTAQNQHEAQNVVDKTKAALKVLNRDTLAILDRTLGTLTSQIGHRHGAPPDE
jgi:hypothetical protein